MSGFAMHVHSYISHYVALADTKAAFVLGLATALLGYLDSLENLHATTRWLKSPTAWGMLDAAACLSTVGLLAATALALATVVPRLRRTRPAPASGRSGHGIVYWRDIAAHGDPGAYCETVAQSDASTLNAALLEQVFQIAVICHRKYRTLSWGTWSAAIGVAAGILLLAFR